MSYCLIPYMIDLAQLRSAVGGKDAGLVRAIRSSNPEKFDDPDPRYPLTLGDALSHLVMGEPNNPKVPHQYGYALEVLCQRLGQGLGCDMWGGVRFAALDDSGVGTVMGSGPPVTLPVNRDVPVIGYLDRQQVATAVAEFPAGGLTNDDEDLQELVTEYEGWLRRVAAAGKDLVLFFY